MVVDTQWSRVEAITGLIVLTAVLILFSMSFISSFSRDIPLVLAWELGVTLATAFAIVRVVVKLLRTPPVRAYYLGRTKDHHYWFNGAGIWRDNRFYATWEEVDRVELVKAWTEIEGDGEGHTRTSRHGRVIVVLKNGSSFEVGDVIDPEGILAVLKVKYLKRG